MNNDLPYLPKARALLPGRVLSMLKVSFTIFYGGAENVRFIGTGDDTDTGALLSFSLVLEI